MLASSFAQLDDMMCMSRSISKSSMLQPRKKGLSMRVFLFRRVTFSLCM